MHMFPDDDDMPTRRGPTEGDRIAARMAFIRGVVRIHQHVVDLFLGQIVLGDMLHVAVGLVVLVPDDLHGFSIISDDPGR